ncbi:beta-N-acetylhexosaminidase [Geothrix limicola]|uniref:beta-N-acetylhexosaminidase n=1 Tax=Geothrix limicola TaxID=2927978 RepID=A0ABQ5QAV3_9BACT|nr:beta-N-acetylhexosaminidase [Geothrix limicola]GLH71503.1 beta-N-acetylhexosaminidase [Geothrix limicola]
MRRTPLHQALRGLALASMALLGRAQDLIPQPAHYQAGAGRFALGPGTRLVASGAARPIAERLQADLRPATGLPLPVQDKGGRDAIQLALDPDAASLGPEGYRLRATGDRVEIRAFRPAGLFYGVQTLRQLLSSEGFRQAKVEGATWTVPACDIEDQPRFSWRGSHLDVGRHFMPKDFIKKHLDLMALHKLNVFHWHLTEDQGWRLEIKKYPKLTEVGAWRKETVLPMYMKADRASQRLFDGMPHGGFYTQADVKEIVAYAADRFITVVPEIEMPGHSTAAIAAYPELGNFPDRKVEVGTYWGVFPSVYGVEDANIQFLKDVLDEVMALFPSTYIHIGGDECPKSEWARSERALARMKKEGLVPAATTLEDLQIYRNGKGERAEHPALHKLQAWFIRQFDDYLSAKERRLMGWSEILEGGFISASPKGERERPAGQGAIDGGLAPKAAVMSWFGEAAGIEAAKASHDVVMAPESHTYFDYYAAKGAEPQAIGGFTPLEKVYAYDPMPAGLDAAQQAHVLGAQGQLWTEYMATPAKVEFMAWPRLSALAEVVWSPKATRDFTDFQKRLKTHLKRLDALAVGYHPLDKPQSFPR